MTLITRKIVSSAAATLVFMFAPVVSSAATSNVSNFSAVKYLTTDPLLPSQLWDEMKDSAGFNEALDELGIKYENLINPQYANKYNAQDVNNPLFWLARTLNIYRSSDQGYYNIPVTEVHANGRERTTSHGRNAYFPTHFWGKKGEQIEIEMKDIPGDVSCSAAIDPDYSKPAAPKDVVGLTANKVNTYTLSQDALLVLSCQDQTKTMENVDKMIPFHIKSGGTRYPLFVFGLNSAAEWSAQVNAAKPSGNTFMFDGRSRFFVTTDKAKKVDGARIEKLMRESLLRSLTYDKLNGMDGSSWLHQPSRGLFVASYNNCCWANGGQGLTGIETTIPTTSGWGEWHEYGHHSQMGWSWSGLTEITVNLYSLAACYTTQGDVDIKKCHSSSGLNGFSWDQQAVGSLLNSGQTWDFNTEDQFRKATFFGELMTSWPQLYPKLGKAYREISQSNPKEVSSSQQKIDWFALNTSKIAGVNLNTYFQQWHIPVSTETSAQINALNLPQPKKTLHTYTATLTDNTPASLKISLPENAANIGFITNTPASGPTKLTWSETGYSSLYAQVMDSRGRKFRVKLRGTVSRGTCQSNTINSTITCSSGSSSFMSVEYLAKDNPLLPVGHYQGILHLIANDWHKTDWSANVDVSLSITQ